ncbi:MAG: thiolase family protein, partial [Pseudomonadota bacterium]
MRDVYIIGAAMTRFGKFPELTITDMGARAFLDAVKDAGVDPKRIGAVYVGHVRQAGKGSMMAGQRIMREVGVTG